MPHPDAGNQEPGRRARARLTAAAVALALALGIWLVHDGGGARGPPAPAPAPAPGPDTTGAPAGTSAPGAGAQPGKPPPAPLPPSVPTGVRIPSIKVTAPLLGLDLDGAGHLETPTLSAPGQAGWYRNGASPGAPGNAIVAGHADTRSGPAVFYRLGLLRPGDTVEITRQDRRTAVFTIDAVRTYPRSAVPDTIVYGPTERPELRLITCGGKYDKKAGYSDNVVVFAHLTATR
ncbi:class F sortase [Kitasatospora herbaricolor]|uniref:Class F sortase n=1 Tax=Kitasatospora herbaricolor TaxID=68217 RepID=A0ABZ1W2K4_9ACTN|nr:class F sortase [Kitasatospora herbaricolor]